jgi:hypothetical protein
LDRFPEALSAEPDFRGEEALSVATKHLSEVLWFLYGDPNTEFRLLEDVKRPNGPFRHLDLEDGKLVRARGL